MRSDPPATNPEAAANGPSNQSSGLHSLPPWRIQWRVIDALIYRELKTRISQVKFGFFGVLIQPLLVMSIFLLIFGLLRSGQGGPLEITLFLIAGIVLYTLFNNIAIRSLNAMDANEALFFYRPVKPVDTVIARAVVECGLYGLIMIIIVGGVWVYKEEIILSDLLQLVASYMLLSLTALGVGLALMVGGHRNPVFKQVVPLFFRPLWFMSGVFFSLQSIPQNFRPFLSWNPILQSIELARNAFNQSYPLDPSISMGYLAFCSLLCLAFGLGVYVNNEKKLLTR